MNFNCKRDAPVKCDFTGFCSRESLIFHRDTYMAPQGEILAAYSRSLREGESVQAGAEIFYRESPPKFGSRVPDSVPNKVIRDAAGGYFAHKCFFESLGDGKLSSGALMKIHNSFGSAQSFFQRFSDAAKNTRENGFLWLCEKKTNGSDLHIVFTKNNTLPPPHLRGILCLDMWEHAISLSEKKTRRDYAAAFLENADFTKLK